MMRYSGSPSATTFYLVVVCILGQIGIAFVFSMLLNSKNILLKGIHRTVIFFPSVLSAVVIGFVWTMIYDYKYGPYEYPAEGDGFVAICAAVVEQHPDSAVFDLHPPHLAIHRVLHDHPAFRLRLD